MAADRVARLYARSDQLCSAAPCSDEPGDALSVSGSMSLVYGQAAWKRFEASFARKSLPCSSVRAFPHTVCLRLPRRSDELSTRVLRAARWRCQCWRGHSRLIDRRWWRAGCSRLRTKWLAGRRVEFFSAARAERMAPSGADGFFEGEARGKRQLARRKSAPGRARSGSLSAVA